MQDIIIRGNLLTKTQTELRHWSDRYTLFSQVCVILFTRNIWYFWSHVPSRVRVSLVPCPFWGVGYRSGGGVSVGSRVFRRVRYPVAGVSGGRFDSQLECFLVVSGRMFQVAFSLWPSLFIQMSLQLIRSIWSCLVTIFNHSYHKSILIIVFGFTWGHYWLDTQKDQKKQTRRGS